MHPAAESSSSTINATTTSSNPSLSSGLTSDEARACWLRTEQMRCRTVASAHGVWRLPSFGHRFRMLEAAIILQKVLHEYVEAAVIAGLLVSNAVLGFFQEGRAQATLAALKSRLALTASVRRDGVWKIIPATELVPGDTLKPSWAVSLPPTRSWSRDRSCSINPCSLANPFQSKPGRA